MSQHINVYVYLSDIGKVPGTSYVLVISICDVISLSFRGEFQMYEKFYGVSKCEVHHF